MAEATMPHKPIHIEFVCSDNSILSPMAERIARELIQQRGLEGKMETSCSGSSLHHFFDKTPEEEFREQAAAVARAYANGVYEGMIAQQAKRVADAQGQNGSSFVVGAAPVNADPDDIAECYGFLVRSAEFYRNTALAEIGLLPDRIYHNPTRASPEVNLVLSMTEGEAAQVRWIYELERAARLPEIVPLHDYANGWQRKEKDRIYKEVSNPLGSPGMQIAYQLTRQQLRGLVLAALLRAVTEPRAVVEPPAAPSGEPYESHDKDTYSRRVPEAFSAV